MKSRSGTSQCTAPTRRARRPSVIGSAPLQRLIGKWREGQRLAAQGIEPESGLSEKEQLDRLLGIFDDEETNVAVDQLERPN